MSRSDLKANLIELIESNQRLAGTDFSGSFRDVLTQMYHIADEKGYNIEERFQAAGEVYQEEAEDAIEQTLKEKHEKDR